MHSITRTTSKISTVLVIDLSSAVDEHGWMDSHSALKLLHHADDAVEVNIGNARAGYALDLMAEFLQVASHITIKGTDPVGLQAFRELLSRTNLSLEGV